jgi:hypothetical protein
MTVRASTLGFPRFLLELLAERRLGVLPPLAVFYDLR